MLDGEDDEQQRNGEDILKDNQVDGHPDVNDEEGEVIVSFGDDSDENADDTDLVKHLREQLRERDRRIAETSKPKPTPVDPGPKPTLADCDYDEEAYEAKLDKWKDDKRASESAETDVAEQQRQANEAWQNTLLSHYEKAKVLPVKPEAYKAAEQNIVSTLSIEQQSAIVRYSRDSAKLILALDKQPGQLTELAKITDAGALVYKIAELDGKLKMTTKRKAPPPPESETIVRGSASLTVTTDKEEARLQKEGDKTGDYSALAKYRYERKRKSA